MDTGEKVALGVCATLVVVGTGFVGYFIPRSLRDRYVNEQFYELTSDLRSKKIQLKHLQEDIAFDEKNKTNPDYQPTTTEKTILGIRKAQRIPEAQRTDDEKRLLEEAESKGFRLDGGKRRTHRRRR